MNKLFQLLKANANKDAPTIRADASGDVGHVYVYDVIDSYWGASAKALVEALAGMKGKPVALHLNSPGGDVFEARAMVSALRAHGSPVTTYIDGLAASAATYLALSGDQVHITDGGMFMVHNSWTVAWGNKTELRSTADLLDKIDGTIAADYMRKTKASTEQVTAWMEAETWFTAQEAFDAGFVDAIDGQADAPAAMSKWNLSAYANAPRIEPPKPEPELSAIADNQSRLNRSRFALLTHRT